MIEFLMPDNSVEQTRYSHINHKNGAWVGVDLDATLATYNVWVDEMHIGEPIPKMVDRVKIWVSEGVDVRIFTARVGILDPIRKQAIINLIEAWCLEHIGAKLQVTNEKDYGMVELWDDRVVRVRPNTGIPCCDYGKQKPNGIIIPKG